MNIKTVRADGSTIELDISEEDALSLLVSMREAFGWSGCEFSRLDVENTLDRPITDDEWEKIRTSYEWERTLPEQACESGFYAMDLAISENIKEQDA